MKPILSPTKKKKWCDVAERKRRKLVVKNISETFVIIIIIIRKGLQCKAGRERLTPYQSKDPNPTIPTHRMKEEKGKTVGDKK